MLVPQSCLPLCNPMECSPWGSSVHGLLQARMLERVAIPFSKGSSWPRDWTYISCIAGRFFTVWATVVFPSGSPGEGNGNPHQYSCLKNSMDRGVCGLQSMGSQSQTWLTTCMCVYTHTHTHTHSKTMTNVLEKLSSNLPGPWAGKGSFQSTP